MATQAQQSQYNSWIASAAAQYGLNPAVLWGLISTESGFDPNAVSSAGAVGIAQFEPGTADQYGVDTSDPKSSIFGAAHYLSDLLQEFHGSYTAAITAYNAGPGNVQKYGTTGAAQVPGADPNYLSKVLAATTSSPFGSGGLSGSSSGDSTNNPNIVAGSAPSSAAGTGFTPAPLPKQMVLVLALVAFVVVAAVALRGSGKPVTEVQGA